ncbi:hypothetical protein [Nostoc sp. 'Peltigera membranacea cyanobiont' 210A]|nr:hypothetical protein [Nostoc sp. 'Peltigera membranacea cyanobiont' 210A]
MQYHHELTFLEPRLNRQTALLATDAIAEVTLSNITQTRIDL